jgi:hypothetical protein
MKKMILSIAVVFGLVLVFVPVNKADEVDFIVSASIPDASGVSIVATEVDSQSDVFGNTTDALDFDPMNYDSQNGIWLPDHYFAIDVGVTGGAGSTDVTVTYTEGSKPIGQTNGLGFKSTATFVKITGPENNQLETELAAHGPKQLLKDLAGGEQLTGAELSGGFLRVYVGIFPGDDQDILNAGGEPFTNADVPGDYDGTLTITATVA